MHLPAGVAHFLEHKMFEDEDGDAFAKFAKTGANANAFTSFDRTCYLFTCLLYTSPADCRKLFLAPGQLPQGHGVAKVPAGNDHFIHKG